VLKLRQSFGHATHPGHPAGVGARARATDGLAHRSGFAWPGSPRGGARPARLPMTAGLAGGHRKALLIAALLALAPPARALPTPANTVIDNTAEVRLTVSASSMTVPSNLVSLTTTESNTTPATIEFLQFAPGSGGASPLTSGPTRCDQGGGFVTLPDPTALGGASIDAESPQPLLHAELYHRGEPVFISVADPDHDLDPAALDTVLVTLTVSGSGDRETLELTETGPNTGVFVGSIMTGAPPATANDCTLAVGAGDALTATYTDFESVTSTAAALVDPYGVVFDSSTGALIDGATVTMIDANTGLPATVYGDDGVSIYPSTVVTGGSVTDSGSTVYSFSQGQYRFPYVQPGDYRFLVTPPAAYLFPSTVPDAALPPGFAIEVGSRGEDFVVDPGPALHIDIPVDPLSSDLFVTKAASAASASIGDFLEWQVALRNGSTLVSATGVVLTDLLPPGLRYAPGSTRIGGAPAADPSIAADGRTLSFAVGTLAPSATVTIRYVTEVGAGTRGRELRNQAQAAGTGGVTSNLATASVALRDDLFGDRATLLGEVLTSVCGAAGTPADAVPGVRVLLEDGSYAITDARGRYHFRGVSAGTHVVQLDLASLPDGYQLVPCQDDTRAAGRAWSRFVDLQRGTLWRADFRVARPAPARGLVTTRLHGTLLAADAGVAIYEFDLAGSGAVPLANLRSSFVLPEGAALVPDSVVVDGAALPGATVTDGVLTLRLGDRPAQFAHKLAFRLALAVGSAESHPLRALLTVDAPTQRNQRSQPVEVTLRTTGLDLLTGNVTLTPRFASRSWTLDEADRLELRRLAERARGMASIRFHVVGHTDGRKVRDLSSDDLADNVDLSRRRAAAVADFLASELGIARNRIVAEGRGDREPIADNRRPAGMALNRRVMIGLVAASDTGSERTVSESPLETIEVVGAQAGTPLVAAVADQAGAEASAAAASATSKDYAPYARAVDGELLASLAPGRAILWPGADANPPIPTIKLAIQRRKGETVELSRDGVPVPLAKFAGAQAAAASDVVVEQYNGVEVAEGDNRFVATILAADGTRVASLERVVHYSGPAVRAELVAERSVLVADGKTRPVIALRFLDRWDRPVHPGATGEFDVGAPYRVWRDLDDRAHDALLQVGDPRSAWHADAEGIARIELAPTDESGETKLALRLADRKRQDLSAWLEPVGRDWVLVGLAEGTVGHRAVDGNASAFEQGVGQPDYYEDGRIAFYAKGMVKGEYLLTVAYDTGKDRQVGGANLGQQIDPNAYYLLYGDATEQGAGAASTRKLYLRLERKQFYALFGDFDTGLTVTELGRYSRRMNGVKSEYRGERFGYSAFASEDTTGFVKDELQGDGTSGLYRLSRRPLVANSERIRLQVRDRFHSERIVSETTLTRFVDYHVDYTAGTLFFRKPVPSHDPGFDQVFIVADYEVASGGEGTVTGGGRGTVRLADGAVEVGVTAIHEGIAGATGDLAAVDVKAQLAPGTELKVELGTSEAESGALTRDGTAYAIRVEHAGEQLAGRAYLREQDAGYGLGQQNGGESGTRKAGIEGTYRIDAELEATGQAFVQQNLATGAERQVAEAGFRYRAADDDYTASAGLRHASDGGLAAGALVSDQLYLGGTAKLDADLTLRAQAELGVGGSASGDYPDRYTFGADYRLTDKASAFVEHELTSGELQDSDMTRIGVRSQPWERGRIDAALEQQYAENGPRLFATLGLGQGWQVDERLLLDFGLDRVQTLRHPGAPSLNLSVPPASGATSDFTALHVGAAYRLADWTINGRLETFAGDSEDRWGLSANAYRAQGEALGLSFRFSYLDSEQVPGAATTDATLSFGLAWRPTDPTLIVLERVDLVYADAFDPSAGASRSYKLINNLNLNHQPTARWQTSYQYAFKWVRAEFGSGYGGFTDLVGVESRFDVDREWDVGGQLYALHSWSSDTVDYAAGLSVGRSFARNVWVSLGYNFAGFVDEDFAGARFTAQGPYLQLRVKFDQDSIADLKSLLVSPPAGARPATGR